MSIVLQILFIIDEAIRMFDRYVPFGGARFCHAVFLIIYMLLIVGLTL